MVESIDWNDGADDPQRPRNGLWRRFWRTLTGQRTGAERCRPVTVHGVDGEPVHTAALGSAPMSDETRAAFAEIVRAAQRKHRAELAAERQAADDDVRGVAAVAATTAAMWSVPVGDVKRREQLWAEALDRIDKLHARFADRIAELEARDTKAGEQQ